MEIDELPENDERLLKKPEIRRDEHGRFEQAGTGLIKKQSKTGKRIGTGLAGPGRPPGAKNKTTLQLREAILAALEAAGGDEGSVGYLRRLAVENSSAFAGLVSKVLPTTLQADESSGGLGNKITFERVIVYPDGHREIDGVTTKQLPAPASHTLPSDEPTALEHKETKDLEP